MKKVVAVVIATLMVAVLMTVGAGREDKEAPTKEEWKQED